MKKKFLLIVLAMALSFTSVSASVNLEVNNETPNKLNLLWEVEENKTYDIYSCESADVTTCELVTSTEVGEYGIDITDYSKMYYYSVVSCSLNEEEEKVCDEVENVVSNYAKTKFEDFNISSKDASSITVTWEEIPNAYYYKVGYKLSTDSEYSEVFTDANEATFDNLKMNGTYVISLTPVFRINEENYESFSLEKEFDMNFMIGNVSAKNTSLTSNKITIEKVEKASGYEIYRSTYKDKKYKKIATITTLTYKDKKLSTGTRYYYKVRAYTIVGGKKVYTAYSNIVSAVPSVTEPNFKVSVKTYNSAKISITKLSGAKGYVIYRSTNKDSGYKQIATTTKTTYEDKKLNPGTTYYYKVRGYSLKGRKKIYGTYSSAYEFYLDLQLPKISYNNPTRDSLEIVASGAKGIEGYEIKLLDGEEVIEVKEGSKVLFSGLEYGKSYKVEAVSYKTINNEKVKSDTVYTYAQVKPLQPVVKMETQLFYDLQFIDVDVTNLENNDDVEVALYRSTSANGEYSKVGDSYQFTNNESLTKTSYDEDDNEISVNGPFDNYELTLVSNELRLKQRYYYKVVVKINGIESKAALIDRVAVTKPEMGIVQYQNKKVKFATMPASSDYNEKVYYEVWRSTKKKGKYTKVFSKALVPDENWGIIVGNISGDFNKTYYYKTRYYKIYNGKKVYSGYSNISKYKNTIRAYDNFPVHLESNYGILHDMTVKSVGFSIKRTSGNNVYYNMKFKFKTTYAAKKTNSTFSLTFYDWEGNEVANVPVTVKLPKGTKKNWSVTKLVRVPKTAVYYEFD